MARMEPRSTFDLIEDPYRRPLEIVCGHVVGRLDHLRIHFVGALGRDQFGDFLDGIDVRALQIALMDLSVSGIAGDADNRNAGRRCLPIEIASERIEARLIRKVGKIELTQLTGRDLVVQLRVHLARIR